MYHAIFLNHVLRLMHEQGMTKQALAGKAGMSLSFLSDLTHGKANPSLKIMSAIANALGVSLASLLDAPDGAPTVGDGQAGPRPNGKLPPGMQRVAAVLTEYQAFHVRQWDAANRQSLAKAKGRRPARPDSGLERPNCPVELPG